MKAKVNYNSIGTSLEPYIGWEFIVVNHNKTSMYIKWDTGNPEPERYKTKRFDRSNFDIKE